MPGTGAAGCVNRPKGWPQKKCHEFETEAGVAIRETTKDPQVTEDQHVTRNETLHLDPDVILMDVRMPGLNGIEATTRLIQAGCRARILMLTTFNLDEYVYHALKAGASGFLLKDASREQLAGAVRGVSAGETLLAPAITRRLIEDFCNGPAPGTPVAGAGGGLSERELGVVRLVAQGLSNAEIAARLYLSEATIKSHIARILAKLGLRDRVQVAVYAYEHGIVRPGHGTPPAGRKTSP
jgi:DNA-binding NarL/FixJ family response regulator